MRQPENSPTLPGGEHYHHGPDKTELEKALSRTAKSIEPYANLILLVGLAATVVLVAAIFWVRSANATRTVGWDEYLTATAPDDFAAVADKFPNAPVAQWARLQAGKLFLSEGLNQALTNAPASRERLEKAQAAFDKLLKGDAPDAVREQALYGMATTLEATSAGDLQPAITAYEQLANEYPGSQHAAWATERATELKSDSASQFYAWFHQQNPRPEDRPLPRDLKSSVPPLPLDVDLPLDLNPSTTPAGDAGATPPAASPEGGAPAFPAESRGDLPMPPALPEPINDDTPLSPPMAPDAPPPSDNPTSESPATPESSTSAEPGAEAPSPPTEPGDASAADGAPEESPPPSSN